MLPRTPVEPTDSSPSGARARAVSRVPRALILGGGAVTLEYYLPALRSLGWSSSATVVEPRPSAAERLRVAYPEITVVGEGYEFYLTRIGGRDDVDGVVVALPNAFHPAACSAALSLGLDVLCEKPLALQHDTCLRLQGEADARGRVLAVGMIYRLLPSVAALRSALDQGLIGDPLRVDVQDGSPYAWASDSGAFFRGENGGVLADIGIHYLDLVAWLLGPLSPVEYADDYEGGVEANAHYELATRAGAPVTISLSRTRVLRNRLVLRGSQGELILDKKRLDACFWQSGSSGLSGWLTKDALEARGEVPSTLVSGFAEQLQRFVGAAGMGRRHLAGGREAAESAALVEWAYTRPARVSARSATIPSDGRPGLAPATTVVTGGTGFIGRALIERLHHLGSFDIRAPVRSYTTCANIGRFPIGLPRVDLLSPTEVADTMRGAQYVFHLAYGREGDDQSRVTVEGTKNVVEAAISNGVEAVIILSTTAVFGRKTVAQPVDEGASMDPSRGYARDKATMETWCLRRAASSGHTRIVVLSPSCVYGPRGKTYTELPAALHRSGSFCWIDGGSGSANYVYVDNLVDAILLAAKSDEAHGQRVIINDGTTTWREFLSPILAQPADGILSLTRAELLALHRKSRPKPRDLLRAVLANPEVRALAKQTSVGDRAYRSFRRLAPAALERAAGWSPPGDGRREGGGGDRPLPPVWLTELFGPERYCFTSERARRLLGWSPTLTLEQGQRRACEWLRADFYPPQDGAVLRPFSRLVESW